ncbi:MAG TPA: septal ring lytic transglycosylase RlpA family protein, partial [Caulobacteraceae bacterium]|nr:septal ring lytic transglycosylase RlpA family protein [Caulobacteraceae bacterium]
GQANGIGPRYPTHEAPDASRPSRQASRPAPQTQAQGPYKVGKPYQVGGVWYTPKEDPDYDEVGIASWYGEAFQFRSTASGEPFDMFVPSAAHKTLPLQSLVEVTNLENGRKIQVRINDRGPFVDGRIIDLSKAAADELGMVRSGVARVRVRYLGVAPGTPQPPIVVASNASPKPATPPTLNSRSVESRVVAMAPIPNPPERAAPLSPIKTSYEVQAAAFADPGAAERLRRQLLSEGLVVVRPLQRNDGVLYGVVVCSLRDEDAAMAVRDHLAAQGYLDARVIRPF